MEHVIIKEKKYFLDTLRLLTGQQEIKIKKIPHNVLVIAEAVEEPYKLPYLLETIKSLEIDDMDKFRYMLLRVQIDSELHMNEDIQKYHKRLFVSQVIEKLLYGDIFFEAGKDENENIE